MLVTIISVLFVVSAHAQSFKINSPNGKLQLELAFVKDLTYSLKVGNEVVLKDSLAALYIKTSKVKSLLPSVLSTLNVIA